MIGSNEILAELERRDIPKAEIAEVIGVDPSQVTRLYTKKNKPRRLLHDEAVKLVEKYGLERSRQELRPVPPAVWQAVADHIALTLRIPLSEDDPTRQVLITDLAAFSRILRSPQAQDLLEDVPGFFRALHYRSQAETEAPE